MGRILKFFLLAMAITVSAEVKLAEKGKTEYTIVAPAKANEVEQAAVKDLQHFLNEITGADFKVGIASKKQIFVGKKAPSDKKPLARYERRVKSDGNNIYIYGWGKFDNAFAVYDFLEHYFGCRWYSFYGDMKIPHRENATFDKIDYSIIPSFNHFGFYGNLYSQKTRDGLDFKRRARIFDLKVDGEPVPFLGGSLPHILCQILPSGNIPFNGNVGNLKGPLKYFKDKKYFKTNPEFFSEDSKGKRIWNYQVCFSNPELRQTLIQNMETVVKNEYKGGPAKMYADLNDKGKSGMPCCYCKKCAELAKKYGHPAGAYWDYLIELCKVFEKKYPDIRLFTLAYQITRNPPKLTKKLPKNLVIGIAPLDETDFIKPYRDTPGQHAYNMIRDWGKIVSGDYNLWVYPTVYPRPLWTRPLVANIKRLVNNLRDSHKLGVNELDAQFGCGPTVDVGFNALRVYILAQLARDVECDVDALTKDFMENYYGAAAPTMLKYYNELEDCESKEKNFMRWWPDHRSVLSYLTPENLLRWQSYFDDMEKTVTNDPRRLLNVRRARINLDEATLSVYYKFKPGTMPDRKKIIRRYKQTLVEGAKDILRTYEDQSEAKKLLRSRVKWQWRSMYYHYALSGKWKPLPGKFGKRPEGDVLRTVPFKNRKLLVEESEAATGIALKGELPEKFSFRLYHWDAPDKEIRQVFEPTITPAMVKKAGTGYHLYYIGTSVLYPDAFLITNDILRASGVAIGYLFDPQNPKQEYDFYVSLKLESGTLWFDQLVLVKSGKIPVTQKHAKDI